MFHRGYCQRGNACWFTHPTKCGNNQHNQQNNIQNNITSHYQQNNNNTQNNRNNNNQIMNNSNGNDYTIMNTNFLGHLPTLGNVNHNKNPGTIQMQPMMQMMQNMMDRITRMDNKLMHIEMGRQIYG